MALQGAGLQDSLLGLLDDEPALRPLDAVRRHPLAHGAWYDLLPGWVSGAEAVFDRLLDAVPWQAERRQMWDREVAVPRLLAFYGAGEALPDPLLDDARVALSARYRRDIGEDLVTAGLCLYRDGRDSVAWHGDRIGRSRTQDTVVAIVSLGASRGLHLRPAGGGPSIKLTVGHGDLFVMGGSCQRTWDHCVPKTARPVGPRISIQFRPAGVR